jgi:hypothetical protein
MREALLTLKILHFFNLFHFPRAVSSYDEKSKPPELTNGEFLF